MQPNSLANPRPLQRPDIGSVLLNTFVFGPVCGTSLPLDASLRIAFHIFQNSEGGDPNNSFVRVAFGGTACPGHSWP